MKIGPGRPVYGHSAGKVSKSLHSKVFEGVKNEGYQLDAYGLLLTATNKKSGGSCLGEPPDGISAF